MDPDGGEAGYLTDVPYVRQFSKELAPPALRAAMALNGFAPPPADDFDYCELGCGTGDTTNTLAAAHPRARFVGVDFNAEHVSFARGLAARGGLGNARFVERDFAELAREALPHFDYVCAHGVLSWISPETRGALLDFAAARLKPGGVLYVTYNALPGWAAVEPLRRLMLDASAGVAGSSLDRARHGASVARLLCDAGAEYFESNSTAKEMLETMLRMGLPYAAHEYFGAHWEPMYFADVATEMTARALGFIGQLPLYLNYRDLTIPPSAMELFRSVSDRASFESLKDYAVNEFFRGDLYVKDSAARDEAVTRSYLETTPFGTLAPAEHMKREVHLRHHVLHFDGPLFDAIIERLADRAWTLPELASDPALAEHGPEAVRQAVLRLLLGEQVAPMHSAPRAVPWEYNRRILEQRLSTKDPVVLASPVAGTGIVVPTLQAVALRLVTGVEPADWPAWIRAFAARQPLKLKVRDREVETVDEQVRVLTEEVEKFRAARLPKLVGLGVVEGAPANVDVGLRG
jgi:SAM-dependent methyltransferase